MAEKSVSIFSNRWNDVLVDYQVAKAAADAVAEKPACRLRDHIFEALAEAIQAIQQIPAPDLKAIVDKLYVYWRAGDLAEGSYGNDFRRMIVGDLRRIERQRAGVAEPGASGGMNIAEIEQRWAERLRDYDHYSRLMTEGTPDQTWSGKTATETQAKRDDAEAALLSLPAPDVAAVIRKIGILFDNDDWYGPIADPPLHASIVDDLRRFAAEEGDPQ